MKKSILVILSLLLLGGCSKNNSTITIEAQDKCATQSKSFFENLKETQFFRGASYTNHYNIKLDKCFILTSGDTTAFQSRNELFDAFENRVIASCTYNPPDGDIKPFCYYPGSNGDFNLEKFRDFAKQYMEE